MIYRIFHQDVATLLSKPETGMGYQIVSASPYGSSQTRKLVVYNSELAVDLDSSFSINKRSIINEGFRGALNKAPELMLETDSIRILEQFSVRENMSVSQLKQISNKRNSGGRGATDSVKTFADGVEHFIRLSAYEDDKRIDFQKMLLKDGSFATTFNDYNDCVSSNDSPVDRYALPNDASIKWAFIIKAKSVDVLQRGIVQPAFNHEGGGVEVYFEKGTSNDTYIAKREYGK